MSSSCKKKLIEGALPLPEINDASAYDKMPGIGPHPKGIHHWWARMSEGAPDDIVRIVTENARTLKFTAQGFEKE